MQAGSGSIDFSNSTVAGKIENSLCNEVKDKLRSIVENIEKVTVDNKEILQELKDIKTELQSENPQVSYLKKSFKAILWGVSITCKAAIEKLVGDAIGLLEHEL